MKKNKSFMLGLSLATALCSINLYAADKVTSDIIGVDGKVIGTTTITDSPHGVLLYIHVKDLKPGAHGMHFHAVADCSDHDKGFKASKGHLNPDGKEHGLLNPKGPEPADLPNLFVAKDGSAEVGLFTPYVSLNDVDGRVNLTAGEGSALIIHADADDHLSQPIGNAGARVACAKIK